MATKIILFIFIFACLNLIREIFFFVKAIREGEPNMTLPRRIGVGASISYILTILITGFAI